MNFRILQFPPQNGRIIHVKAISPAWTHFYALAQDDEFFGSRRDDDDFEPPGIGLLRQINWGALSGMGLSLAFSAGFWAGVALAVQRFLK
jgi:hypothetical protein